MRLLLYIVVILAVSSCGYSGMADGKLGEAQALLDSDPARALEALNGIDVSALHDSDAVARWSLLYSEAMAANNIYAPTDTIINIALDYYARHDDAEALVRAQKARRQLSAIESTPADSLAGLRYLQKEREYRIYVERSRREQFVLISLIVAALALAVIIWLVQTLRLRKAMNEALMAEASVLKLQLSSASADASRMQEALHGLLDKRFTLIDGLCDTYYQSQGTKNERKAIADRVRAEIDAVRTDPAIIAEMERSVNECRSGMLARLKEDYPAIKPEELRLATYLACGLSSRAISLLSGDSIENVYKRKSRLKQRLRELNLLDGTELSAIF